MAMMHAEKLVFLFTVVLLSGCGDDFDWNKEWSEFRGTHGKKEKLSKNTAIIEKIGGGLAQPIDDWMIHCKHDVCEPQMQRDVILLKVTPEDYCEQKTQYAKEGRYTCNHNWSTLLYLHKLGLPP